MTQRKRWLKTREFEKGECVAVRRPGKVDTDRNAKRPPFVCVLVWVYFVHERFEMVEEISVVVKQLLSSRGLTPKVVIQGDILPVIKYFQFTGRLRKLDMHQPLESIRATVSLHLPHNLFIYLPRVANGIADDLAGQASQFLLARYRSDPSTLNRNAGPVSIKPSFPTGLFQVGGFHIQSFEQPWSQPILP